MAILTPPRKKKIVTPANFNDPPNRGPEPLTLTGKTPFEGQTTPQATTTTGLVQEKPEFASRQGAIARAVDTEKQTLPVATKPDVMPIEGKTEPKATFTGGQIADPVQTAADLQRQQVQADAAAAEKVRMEAIARQLGAQGIGDAGIVGARQRGARQDIRHAAGRQLTGIDIAEQQQKTAEMEAAKEREFLGEQGEAQREVALTGIEAQKEIADAEIAARLKGIDVNQELALRGFEIDEQGQLIQKGIAEAGIESQERIAAERETTVRTGQTLENDLFGRKITSDFQKALLVAAMEDLNMDDKRDREILFNILTSFEGGEIEQEPFEEIRPTIKTKHY